MLLKDKVILITGAAKRLGREIALTLAEEKATLALHYHTSEKEIQLLLKELQHKKVTAEIFKADLTNVQEIKKMVENIHKMFSRIDALINNAAQFYPTPFGDIQEKEWNNFLDTNLKGPFFLIQSAVHHKVKNIINIGDSSGPKTRGNYIPYWLSKTGLISMTEVLAKVLPKALNDSVQINTICPGPIDFKEDREKLKNDITVDPKTICQTILYLLKTSSLTGNTLFMDRGRRYK